MIKIRDNLYISNYLDATAEEELVKNGITAVLNVAFEINDPVYDPQKITSFKVGLMDNNQNSSFIKNVAIDLLGLLLSGTEIVLVHCSAGVSRSVFVAVMVISIMEDRDWHDVLVEFQQIYPAAIMSPLFEGVTTPLTTSLEDQGAERIL